ncbi:MAG: PD-(D/E)XK nuclease family protein [Muribaculaceae bacterium]|nr:PD-(D/E)XK nuclease family protein [Muribaculaceae bacterium]
MAPKRIELKQCNVVFNEEEHTYYLPEKDKYLSGITGMLERQLFPDTYDGIPEAIIRQAAEYGTTVHESIEDFDMYFENDGTQEVADYITLTAQQGLIHETSEYLITDNENYASMIDKVYRVDETNFDIGDIKTYGVMTPEKREKARWQLSVYAYLFELQNKKAKVRRIFILHIRNKPKKDGGFDHISDFIELKRIPSEIVKELLLADSMGEQFNNPYAIPEDIRQQESLIRDLIQVKNDAETRLNSIKARILSIMEAQDIKSWATETMRITRKLPTTRSSFSLADFREAHSDIDIEPFMRISQVAGSLTITL